MELPKNVTQIGEADRRCKIYVEDYVISYIRQMNHRAVNKNVGLALYGIQKEEGEVKYQFFYGACILDTLSREVRHLSQAQMQEIEKLRKKFFPDHQFLGYCLLNGEMVEGFYICEQGICRYIAGYACFYEKNDAMLAYMLDSREEEAEPEKVDQEKYERVRARQQSRRQEYQSQMKQTDRSRESRKEAGDEERAGTVKAFGGERKNPRRAKQNPTQVSSGTMHMMRLSVAGMFLLLCVVGIAALYDNGGIDGIQAAADRMWEQLSRRQLPDSEDALSAMNSGGQNGVLYTEDHLTDALQKENADHNSSQSSQGTGQQNPENLPEEAEDDRQSGNGQADGEGQPDDGRLSGEDPLENGEQQTDEPGTAGSESQNSGEKQPDQQETGVQSGQQESDGAQEPDQAPQESEESQTPENSEEVIPTGSPITYIIQKGDTLTGISVSHYGTDKRVKEICQLNNISNPDDIYFGQKILLP